MLRSVAEISDLTGLSKVSIYKKLKLKKFQEFISKNKGITYVEEEGFSLILQEFKIKNIKLKELKSLNNKEKELKNEVAISSENISNNEELEELNKLNKLKDKYINSLKEQINLLKGQLEEKDKQIQELINLNKNNQILLKQQQDKEINQLKLEDHFKEVDERLLALKNKMEFKRKKEKSKFNIFNYFSKKDN